MFFDLFVKNLVATRAVWLGLCKSTRLLSCALTFHLAQSGRKTRVPTGRNQTARAVWLRPQHSYKARLTPCFACTNPACDLRHTLAHKNI